MAYCKAGLTHVTECTGASLVITVYHNFMIYFSILGKMAYCKARIVAVLG